LRLGALLGAIRRANFLCAYSLNAPNRGGYTCCLVAGDMASPLKSTEMTELSSGDREAVLLQTERLLSSSHFRNSRRYTDLLRYAVQQTLDGHAETLKERTLGIEVFGREPSFDTAGDSIVRVAAAEVRKRIALYYQEEGHEHELRVDLPSGAYVARFRRPPEPEPAIIKAHEDLEPAPADKATDVAKQTAVPIRGRRLAFAAAALLLIAIAVLVAVRGRPDAGLNRFWGPVFEQSTPVLICVGTVEPSHISPDFRNRFTVQMANSVNGVVESLVPDTDFKDWPAVSWTDAVEMTRITEMLTRHDKSFQLRSSDGVTLADLRKGPVILLGVLENSWTLRLVSKLRFRPRMDFASQKMWIEDSQHPERKDWSAPWGVAYSESHDDYALVTRAIDPLSGQVSVEIGGLGLHASQAAGEFVTNPVYMNSLSSSLRDQNRNVQIVLKINVIKGEAGPPQIIATYYW